MNPIIETQREYLLTQVLPPIRNVLKSLFQDAAAPEIIDVALEGLLEKLVDDVYFTTYSQEEIDVIINAHKIQKSHDEELNSKTSVVVEDHIKVVTASLIEQGLIH